MSIYESNPDARPDSEFLPGSLGLLVAGNRGRFLDPRRTPFTIVEVRIDRGTFVARLDDFEDKGAHWEEPLECWGHVQIARDARRASPEAVAAYCRAVDRFDRSLSIPATPAARAETEARLRVARREARDWIRDRSRFVREGRTLPDPGTRKGDPVLFEDLRAYLAARGVDDLEAAFARFVSNPGSGDLVTGHRVVLAEMGLVPYEGMVTRDPDVFAGAWSRERRALHVLARLGFTFVLFARFGRRLTLYRGINTEGALLPARNRTFVSATFSEEVARSHYETGGPGGTRALYRQSVPIRRVFMTYHETEAMNRRFLEAEAALLFEEGPVF